MASTTVIETVTITRPLKPGEFARRMLGERPAAVPPTRELWPPPPPPRHLSISTLQLAYSQDELGPHRAATLPSQHPPPPPPPERRPHERKRVCTVGTNTDPPLTFITRIIRTVRKRDDTPTGALPPTHLTAMPSHGVGEEEREHAARRALTRIKKAITGAKYRIAPGTETVDSPKIVYDTPKPGDRMTTTFGISESRRWCRMPSQATCARKFRAVGGWCAQPRRPSRREPQPPRLQITQV